MSQAPTSSAAAPAAIPLVDLKAQYESIKPEIDAAVLAAIASGQFILGPEVAAFERDFAQYCGARFGVAMNSGTSALHLALLAAGVERGDEIITTPFTFIATLAAIDYCGAKPVLVDIDPATFTIDPARIAEKITPRTKAILPVHLYGQPADMDAIMAIARAHDLRVIEDACQAHGAEYKGRRVGSIGELGAFSFYPGKNLGAYGEGGLATTSDPLCLKKLSMLRDWGAEKKYHHEIKGYNMRMDGLQGAILRVKLGHLEAWTQARQRAAAYYTDRLAPLGFATPYQRADVRHVFHVYAIRVAKRDFVIESLRKAGVHAGIHYPIPAHLQPAFAELGHKSGDFPETERAASEVLSLPLYPEITRAQQDRVIEALVAARDLAASPSAAA